MEWQADRPRPNSLTPHLPPVRHEAQLRSHEDLLRRLYVTENKTMKAVMDYMETSFQLKVGVSTYTRVFRELNIRKNAKGDHWAYVDDRIRKRQRRGKSSLVFAQGRLVEPKKVKKEIARHVTTLQQIASDTGPGPATPDGWTVETPGNEENAATERPEEETIVLKDKMALITAHFQAAEAVKRILASGDSYRSPFAPIHAVISENVINSPEDEKITIVDNGTVTMPDCLAIEATRDDATALSDMNQSGNNPNGVGLHEIQPQASRDFYNFLPPPPNIYKYNNQVGYLAMRLHVCKAFTTFSSPSSESWEWPSPSSESWEWPEAPYKKAASSDWPDAHYAELESGDWPNAHYKQIAWDIHLSISRGVVLVSYSSTPAYREAIQIIVCTMANHAYRLWTAFASGNRAFRGKQADDVLQTALFLTAAYGLAEAARTLVVLGADQGATDIYGDTCRRLAEKQGHREVAALLKNHDGPVSKGEFGTGIDKRTQAVDYAQKENKGSGPFGFNKWFDSVVMPWAYRNWDSVGSSLSNRSFWMKSHSRPTSK